jgi:hypothetical protein
MFKDSAVILDAIRRSFLTKSAAAAAAAMSTSVLDRLWNKILWQLSVHLDIHDE